MEFLRKIIVFEKMLIRNLKKLELFIQYLEDLECYIAEAGMNMLENGILQDMILNWLGGTTQ